MCHTNCKHVSLNVYLKPHYFNAQLTKHKQFQIAIPSLKPRCVCCVYK